MLCTYTQTCLRYFMCNDSTSRVMLWPQISVMCKHSTTSMLNNSVWISTGKSFLNGPSVPSPPAWASHYSSTKHSNIHIRWPQQYPHFLVENCNCLFALILCCILSSHSWPLKSTLNNNYEMPLVASACLFRCHITLNHLDALISIFLNKHKEDAD